MRYYFNYIFNIFDQFNNLYNHNLLFSFYQNLEFLKLFKVKLGFKTALELLYENQLQNTYWFFVPDLAIFIESENALLQTGLSIDGGIGENKYLQNQIDFDYLFPSINQLLDKRIDFTWTSKMQYKKIFSLGFSPQFQYFHQAYFIGENNFFLRDFYFERDLWLFNLSVEAKLKLSQYFQFSIAYRLYQDRVFLISLPQHQLNLP